MLKHNSFFIYLFISLNVLFAQENIYDRILEYRCKNDTDIVLIENEAAIALNNYKSVRLNSLFAFDFSSTLNFNLSSEKDKSGFSVQPSISAGMPLYNNLGLKLSAPYSYKMGKSSQDFSLGLSGDIYSQARKRKKQEIETSLEALKEAENKVRRVKELAEKKLLTDIQKILNEYSALLSKRLSGIQADINYKQILAEGYSETSSKNGKA